MLIVAPYRVHVVAVNTNNHDVMLHRGIKGMDEKGEMTLVTALRFIFFSSIGQDPIPLNHFASFEREAFSIDGSRSSDQAVTADLIARYQDGF